MKRRPSIPFAAIGARARICATPIPQPRRDTDGADQPALRLAPRSAGWQDCKCLMCLAEGDNSPHRIRRRA